MALLNKYLLNCSPYIYHLSYDLNKREILIVCAKQIYDWTPGKQIRFSDVRSFSEQVFEDDILEDDLIDSIIGLHEISEGIYCLYTEKRELIIGVGTEPVGEICSPNKTNP